MHSDHSIGDACMAHVVGQEIRLSKHFLAFPLVKLQT